MRWWDEHAGRRGPFGLVMSAALAVIAATSLMAGTAHAAGATLSVSPNAVAPGGSLTVSGTGWGPGIVTLTFLQGNTVLQAGTADAGPNGGPISKKVTAPSAPGAWQACADGLQQSDGAPVSVCANFTVDQPATTPPTTVANTPPPTTAPPVTTAPASTSTSSTTTSSTSTTSTTSTTPGTAPPTSALPTAPPTTAPVTLPPSPDGNVVLDEPSSTGDGSGLSGLTIGLLIGIGVLTAAGVVGMLSSGIGARPHPAGAIGVVVVGGLLAGAVVVAMPPPKVNVPKLSITRVQTSATLRSNSGTSLTANCPAGQVVLGGGWSSDWDTNRIDDPQPMVQWMESTKLGVYDPSQVVVPGGDLPALAFWYIARADKSAHLSDQAWESNRFAWYYQHLVDLRQQALDDDADDIPPMPEPINIPYRPDVAQAFAWQYYWAIDQRPSRGVGLIVERSVPVKEGWTVKATLPKQSLQSSVTLRVVAVCAPLATTTGDPGVLGVTQRSASVNGQSNTACNSGEVLTSIGFTSGTMGGLVKASPSPDLRTAKFTATNGPETLTVVCVSTAGLATTTASGSTTVTAGWDGSTSASCPSGYTVVGGGLDTVFRPRQGTGDAMPEAISSMLPLDNKTFGAGLRSHAVNGPADPSGPGLIEIPQGSQATPLSVFASHDTTELSVTAICAKRVLG